MISSVLASYFCENIGGGAPKSAAAGAETCPAVAKVRAFDSLHALRFPLNIGKTDLGIDIAFVFIIVALKELFVGLCDWIYKADLSPPA